MLGLIVVHDFGPYKRGDQITVAKDIEDIKESENHANVVQVSLPDPPSSK